MNLWKRSSSSSQHDKSLISKARISLMKKNIHLSRKNVLLNSPSNTYRNESEVQRSRNEMFLEQALILLWLFLKINLTEDHYHENFKTSKTKMQ